MGGAASVDCTSNSNYRYGETPEVQASDDTSWIGTKLDMPLKPFSVENYFELLDIVGTGMLGKHAWFENVDWDAVPLRQVTAPFVPTLACAGDTTNFDDYPSSSEETPPLDNDASRQEFLNF
ncbi:hypothetical protein PC118_g13583 [Phytophthora cactorum]|uniref:AGC-kinase C-terminal domain-containing protein n=1 Tax=Phytophthora cactorum TaxID=29920 RepID=A0A8T1FQ09_9STRA|nr:hypothetical protein PC118_g13583 [Phytophthora cactorum]